MAVNTEDLLRYGIPLLLGGIAVGVMQTQISRNSERMDDLKAEQILELQHSVKAIEVSQQKTEVFLAKWMGKWGNLLEGSE